MLLGAVVYEFNIFCMVIVSLYPVGKALLLTPVNVMIWFEVALHDDDPLILDGLLNATTK
jgi:hypothetical protein